jgi:hypothetical protein
MGRAYSTAVKRALAGGTHIRPLLTEASKVSTLTDEINQLRSSQKSGIDVWFDNLDKDDQKAFLDACKDTRVSTKSLCSLVRKHGGRVGDDLMKEWRNGRIG